MKKYNVCMPVELEFERRRQEIALRNRNRALKGLEPVKEDIKPPEASESHQEGFSDDEPIPYRLTPLGVAVVEGGLVIAELHSINDLKSYGKSYEDWRRRTDRKARKAVKKIKKVDNQRNCKQLSIFEEEGRESQ